MNDKRKLSEKWIKASVLGTIWASSEIVLGSFLHNLRIPFSGNILTAIALVLLIAASHKWKEKGLFWRSGLICALMKTMSPSAVIFGPMVAIIMEAFLLEVSVRLLGRTIVGYVLGSVLAMSWVLFQKIANYIIYYGYNLVKVYEDVMMYAREEFNWNFDAVWMPVLILLGLYAFLGIISAIIGMRTGRKLTDPSYDSEISYKSRDTHYPKTTTRVFDYSVVWLVVNMILIIGCLLLANYISFLSWSLLIVLIVIIWAIRYKRALRQLVRPKFWVFFVFITMVTAIVFSRLESADYSTWDGIRIGIEMNLRAILLIMGFTVLGTELYNPSIRNYLQEGRFSQLTLAMELSFNTLPSIISDIPDLKTMVQKPGRVIYHLLSNADNRLEEIHRKQRNPARIFILTGERDEGKTRNLRFTIYNLQFRMVSVGGIYSPKVIEDGMIRGYDVVDIMTGERFEFLRKGGRDEDQRIGSYYIRQDGLEKGLKAIDRAIEAGVEVIAIDEVGRLELQGKGWAPALRKALAIKDIKVYLVVRKDFVEEVVEEFGIEGYEIVLPTP